MIIPDENIPTLTSQNGKNIGAVMVVGGGIAGMQASLDLADAGFKVYMVEKEPAIGGHMAALDKTFPTNDCAMCTISPRLVSTAGHNNIEVLTDTELLGLDGEPGHFTATIRRNPRYIEAYLFLANLYDDLGTRDPRHYQAALDTFGQLLLLDETNVDALLNMGLTYAKMKKHAEARELWTRLLRIDPGNQDALHNLRILEQQILGSPLPAQ